MARCGWDFSVCLDNEGFLWSFGNNNKGSLGRSTSESEQCRTPSKVEGLNDIIHFDCSFYGAACVDIHGSVFAFGTIGEDNMKIPRKIEGMNAISSVACGKDHVLFLEQNGQLWGLGGNMQGQLGLGDQGKRSKATRIPVSDIIAISGGHDLSIIMNSDHKLLSCGKNDYSQLGHQKGKNDFNEIEGLPDDIVSFSCGGLFSIFLDSMGNVYGLGYNGDGQMGLGHTETQKKPTKLSVSNIAQIATGFYHSMCINVNGEFMVTGLDMGIATNGYGGNLKTFTLVPALSDACSMSSGGFHCFINNGGTYFVFGNSAEGQLDKNTEKPKLPVTPFDPEFAHIIKKPKSNAKSAKK